ncbi:MAG: ParB/RepB/Spo0J family partition protein [Desulfobacteraceae bacterium]|jgi:ParB/RepB/Spo0J family partition protein
MELIDIEKIDLSPFQHRRHMSDDKLRELALSITCDGLIEPVILRRCNGRFQLICGERRLRAVKEYTDMRSILSRVIEANDLEARRMCAAENLQRENLSVIETIETIVDLVDSELCGDKVYDSMGESAILRLKNLLAKLDSIRSSRDRGSKVSDESNLLFHKFMEQVENIFKKLPKSLKWRSFYENDLQILMDTSEEVLMAAIDHNLNRSQVKALEGLKRASHDEFKRITGKVQGSSGAEISGLSANEIKDITDKARKMQLEQPCCTAPGVLPKDMAVFSLNRLGYSGKKIASLLSINRKTVMSYIQKKKTANRMKKAVKAGKTVSQAAIENRCPLAPAWSIALEHIDDMERFRLLGWGLRTWDYWFYNDVDKRFGDNWPGRIPAQMVAHILYYFTDQGDLVMDPMAGGGVVPDTCLVMNRRCMSFDMAPDPAARPEIEKWYWDTDNMKWPLDKKTKPDLILFDPPYFSKKADDYHRESIASLSKKEYIRFFERFFTLAGKNSKKDTITAIINADWRDFQGRPAKEETWENSILIDDYLGALKKGGWKMTHMIQAPMSSERFNAGVVSAMQKKKILGVTSRYVIVAKKQG